MPDFNEPAYRARLNQMTRTLAAMVAHAEVDARHRCLYRDRNDRCTALFRCRNQLPVESDAAVFACGHNGTFDCRTAWETQPRERMRVKQKIADIKAAAEARRHAPDIEGIPS